MKERVLTRLPAEPMNRDSHLIRLADQLDKMEADEGFIYWTGKALGGRPQNALLEAARILQDRGVCTLCQRIRPDTRSLADFQRVAEYIAIKSKPRKRRKLDA